MESDRSDGWAVAVSVIGVGLFSQLRDEIVVIVAAVGIGEFDRALIGPLIGPTLGGWLVQMLSMSLGVTVAGAILSTFTGLLPQVTESNSLPAFHATFLCVGIITAATAWIFGQLAPEVRAARRKPDPSESN